MNNYNRTLEKLSSAPVEWEHLEKDAGVWSSVSGFLASGARSVLDSGAKMFTRGSTARNALNTASKTVKNDGVFNAAAKGINKVLGGTKVQAAMNTNMAIDAASGIKDKITRSNDEDQQHNKNNQNY